MEQYTLRYDGGGYIGKCPIYDQAMGAARDWKGRTREIVVHPDGDITHLWDGER